MDLDFCEIFGWKEADKPKPGTLQGDSCLKTWESLLIVGSTYTYTYTHIVGYINHLWRQHCVCREVGQHHNCGVGREKACGKIRRNDQTGRKRMKTA